MSDCPSFVTMDQAQGIVAERIKTLATVTCALDDALGRTLAADIRCDLDAPPFDRAMMDGYAVRSSDVREARSQLRVVGQIAAGGASACELRAGEAIQINTGAALPTGSDTVVKVEDTVISDGDTLVTVNEAYPPEKNVCRRGTYVSAGDVVLRRGMALGPSQIAVAATVGAATLEVYAIPRIAVLVTGDELVEVTETPVGSQIRDSNGPALVALIREAGAEAVVLGAAGDDKAVLEEKIRRGLACDCLCITGGNLDGGIRFCPRNPRSLWRAVRFSENCDQAGQADHLRRDP